MPGFNFNKSFPFPFSYIDSSQITRFSEVFQSALASHVLFSRSFYLFRPRPSHAWIVQFQPPGILYIGANFLLGSESDEWRNAIGEIVERLHFGECRTLGGVFRFLEYFFFECSKIGENADFFQSKFPILKEEFIFRNFFFNLNW